MKEFSTYNTLGRITWGAKCIKDTSKSDGVDHMFQNHYQKGIYMDIYAIVITHGCEHNDPKIKNIWLSIL